MTNEQQTFRCFACEAQKPASQQVECCGCEQNICAACSERRACACELLKMLPVVSADAKIPIVPVEFSPPPDVVNRSPLHTEEVPRLVKGERRARTERTATARNEYPGDQRVDRLGPQDDSQVHAGGGLGTGVWPTFSTAEQARCVQAVFGRAAGRRGVERAGVAARTARA